MDYAKFAIVSYIVATALIALLGRKFVFREFVTRMDRNAMFWRAYLSCAMVLGGAVAIGLTFVVKLFA